MLDPCNTIPGKVLYISVIKSDRVTTKTHIEYDTSAKQNSPSLNDCLETDPCLIPELTDVLIRFRIYPMTLLSD